MKPAIRVIFRTLRAILGPFMLLGELATRPKGLTRSAAHQAEVDEQCRNLALYQYRTCPFCIKVRQEMHRLTLRIELIDAQLPGKSRDDLIRGGGQAKVPCLKITDVAGETHWLFESGEIVKYLRGRFAAD